MTREFKAKEVAPEIQLRDLIALLLPQSIPYNCNEQDIVDAMKLRYKIADRIITEVR
jgi:hypothetical protein